MRRRFDPTHPTAGYRTGWVADPHLRVSDAERNEVSERLARHFTDGRLDQSELSARLDQATRAKTRGDLDGLFDDLPRLADEPSPPRARRRRLLPLLLVMILVVVAADSALSLVHVSWLLVVAVGLLVWHRLGRRHHHPSTDAGR
jgi:Flp pilus assembly protein TadB